MNKVILVIAIIISFVSCTNTNNAKTEITTPEKTIETNQNISLEGKKLEYNYGDYMYEINFLPVNKLHWKCIKGNEKGAEADETYFTQRLNNYTLFVSWVEKDGLGVSQVINLKDNTVNCFLKIDKEIIPMIGTVREL